MKRSNSLAKPASYVIVSRDTGKAVAEIFETKLIAKLNKQHYRAVPVLEYLGQLNRKNPSKIDLTASAKHFKRSVTASRIHSKLMQRALKKYGQKGPWISGVGQDHFPESVKEQLRKYAYMVGRESDAAYKAKPKRVRTSTMRKLATAEASKRGSGFYGAQPSRQNPKRTPARLRPHLSEVKAARARLMKKYANDPAMTARLRARFKAADR